MKTVHSNLITSNHFAIQDHIGHHDYLIGCSIVEFQSNSTVFIVSF